MRRKCVRRPPSLVAPEKLCYNRNSARDGGAGGDHVRRTSARADRVCRSVYGGGKNQLIEALMGVVDPEIGMDIVNLGLVYELHKDESGRLKVVMTLTAVGCPLAPAIVGDVRRALLGLEKYSDVEVELAYSPPWDRSRLSRVAKMALGLY